MRSCRIALLFMAPLVAFTASTLDGIFTKEQALRGEAMFRADCVRCHGANLAGTESAPELAGADFQSRWKARKVFELFDTIRETMPTDDPGNLTAEEVSDLTAYILQANRFPAGTKELDGNADSLKAIVFEASR